MEKQPVTVDVERRPPRVEPIIPPQMNLEISGVGGGVGRGLKRATGTIISDFFGISEIFFFKQN